MKYYLILLFCFVSSLTQAKDVVINQQKLNLAEIDALEVSLGYDIDSGAYWYDAKSGLWGLEGQDAKGIAPAHLVTSSMNENCSNGDSCVFINDRRLASAELNYLQQNLSTIQFEQDELINGINTSDKTINLWLNHLGQGGLLNQGTQFQLNWKGSKRAFCQTESSFEHNKRKLVHQKIKQLWV